MWELDAIHHAHGNGKAIFHANAYGCGIASGNPTADANRL